MPKTAQTEKTVQQTCNATDNAAKLLEKITGTSFYESSFGQPFKKAFSTVFAGSEEAEATVAAYTCTLFLSVILLGFPSHKLHTFVHNANEEWRRILFSCNRYKELQSCINDTELECICLLDKSGKLATHSCSRQEINEAFDFYTNI